MYLSEFQYRWNRQKASDAERFEALLGQPQGRLDWYLRLSLRQYVRRLIEGERREQYSVAFVASAGFRPPFTVQGLSSGRL